MTHDRRKLLLIVSAGAAAAFIMTGFLVPPGEGVAYLALVLALALTAGAAIAFAYAAWEEPQKRAYDDSLYAAVDMVSVQDERVPAAAAQGNAPVVAFVREGTLPHPELTMRLLPYFADSSLGFVQAATRYQGRGRTADAFRAQMLLADMRDEAAAAINAGPLYGSGSLVAHDALAEAYRPGMTFAELGARIQARGYTSTFEPRPLVLAWAPQTLEEYRAVLVRTLTQALHAWRAPWVAGLPLSTRLQYAARPALYLGLISMTLSVYLSFFTLLVRGVGPVILSVPALPGILLSLIGVSAGIYALKKLAQGPVLAPAMLGFVGIGLIGYRLAQDVWEKLPKERVQKTAGALVRTVTVRVSGNGGTAPAGTPARS